MSESEVKRNWGGARLVIQVVSKQKGTGRKKPLLKLLVYGYFKNKLIGLKNKSFAQALLLEKCLLNQTY